MNKTEQKEFDALKAENLALKSQNELIVSEGGIGKLVEELNGKIASQDAVIAQLNKEKSEQVALVAEKVALITELMEKVEASDKSDDAHTVANILKVKGKTYVMSCPAFYIKHDDQMHKCTRESLKDNPELLQAAIGQNMVTQE